MLRIGLIKALWTDLETETFHLFIDKICAAIGDNVQISNRIVAFGVVYIEQRRDLWESLVQEAHHLQRILTLFIGGNAELNEKHDFSCGGSAQHNIAKQTAIVAKKARFVVGIEYVPEAIEDAKVNAALNGQDDKTLFYAGDMKDILTDDFIAEHGRPDVIITDPPRAGMHADVVNVILNAAPQRIVYVSCNPATQARDLQLLDAKYRVVKVQPVDMFPQTHHVENVVQLELR